MNSFSLVSPQLLPPSLPPSSSLSLRLFRTTRRLSVQGHTCKVQTLDRLTSVASPAVLKRQLFLPEDRALSTSNRGHSLSRLDQNYVLLFRPWGMNWSLFGSPPSSSFCGEIQDSLNGRGMFGVRVILRCLYERATERIRLEAEQPESFSTAVLSSPSSCPCL